MNLVDISKPTNAHIWRRNTQTISSPLPNCSAIVINKHLVIVTENPVCFLQFQPIQSLFSCRHKMKFFSSKKVFVFLFCPWIQAAGGNEGRHFPFNGRTHARQESLELGTSFSISNSHAICSKIRQKIGRKLRKHAYVELSYSYVLV